MMSHDLMRGRMFGAERRVPGARCGADRRTRSRPATAVNRVPRRDRRAAVRRPAVPAHVTATAAITSGWAATAPSGCSTGGCWRDQNQGPRGACNAARASEFREDLWIPDRGRSSQCASCLRGDPRTCEEFRAATARGAPDAGTVRGHGGRAGWCSAHAWNGKFRELTAFAMRIAGESNPWDRGRRCGAVLDDIALSPRAQRRGRGHRRHADKPAARLTSWRARRSSPSPTTTQGRGRWTTSRIVHRALSQADCCSPSSRT